MSVHRRRLFALTVAVLAVAVPTVLYSRSRAAATLHPQEEAPAEVVRAIPAVPQEELDDPPSQETIVEFPVGESGGLTSRQGTAWKVHYARGLHKGLYITGAWFKRSLDEDWIKILEDARIAELFVPYHQSSDVRYFDLTTFSFPLAEVRAEDAGPFGTLMPPFSGDPFPRVVREVRDRGVVWKDWMGVRRGKEMILWSGLQAGNYMYMMQYGFQDDGTIAFRVGATGQNLPGARAEAHMHDAHWRIDIDLIDGNKNSAMVMRHVEDINSLSAEDQEEPFNGGIEGGIDWNPLDFTMIRVESEVENPHEHKISYDLMPIRMGSARHQEDFTHHDLWVTKAHPEDPLEKQFSNLPTLVSQPEPEVVEQTDIVLWYTSSMHHEPRDEDGKGSPPAAGRWFFDDGWQGSALVMWSGFDLRPRNLFDRTPFYPYSERPARPFGGDVEE